VAIRATISLTTIQAGIAHSKLAATVSAQAITATGIYVDPDSLNRSLVDTYAVADVTFILIQKTFNESVSLADTSLWALDKTPADPITLSDNIVKSVSWNRAFSDGFFLDDTALINKDFVGAKGNLFGVSDTNSWGFNKGVTDPLTLSDTISTTLSYARTFTDSTSITDLPAIQLDVLMTPDSMSMSDTVSILHISASSRINASSFNVATFNS